MLCEARFEEFRTFFNFKSRLLAVEDTVKETLEQQALVLRDLESRVKEVSAGAVLLLIALLQVGCASHGTASTMSNKALAGAIFDAALGNSAVASLTMPWE